MMLQGTAKQESQRIGATHTSAPMYKYTAVVVCMRTQRASHPRIACTCTPKTKTNLLDFVVLAIFRTFLSGRLELRVDDGVLHSRKLQEVSPAGSQLLSSWPPFCISAEARHHTVPQRAQRRQGPLGGVFPWKVPVPQQRGSNHVRGCACTSPCMCHVTCKDTIAQKSIKRV